LIGKDRKGYVMSKIENIEEESKTIETIKPSGAKDKKEITKSTKSTKTIETFNEQVKDQTYLEEWKECRSAIAKYGDFVHSIRKFGFTIITGLLSANAYIFIKFEGFQPWEKLLLSSILCLLIFGLYITDTYYLVLVRASVDRAKNIEKGCELNLTTKIGIYAEQDLIDLYSLLVYILFIIVCIIPSLIIGLIDNIPELTIFSFVILVLAICGIIYLHLHTIGKRSVET
jgi:hypothetical protein